MSLSKLSTEDKLKIVDQYRTRHPKQSDLAAVWGITQSDVSLLLNAFGVTKSPPRKIGRTPGDVLTADDKKMCERLTDQGMMPRDIARQIHRRDVTVRKYINEYLSEKSEHIEVPVVRKPVPVVAAPAVAPTVEDGDVVVLRRSMERLHDRVSKLGSAVESLAHRLTDITAAISKVQQSADRLTREFVNTNPPPPEITFPTRVNGSHNGQ